jgi:hypothetical protein
MRNLIVNLCVATIILLGMGQSYNIPFNPQGVAAWSCSATICDSFDVDDSLSGWTAWNPTGTLGSSVVETNGTFESNTGGVVHIGNDTNLGNVNQWMCAVMTEAATFGHLGFAFRMNNTDGTGYVAYLRSADPDDLKWAHFDGSATYTQITEGLDTDINRTEGNWLCVTVEGISTATKVYGFEFDAEPADYQDKDTWEGLGSYVQTFNPAADCGGNCEDTGNYVGIYGFDNDGPTVYRLDNFKAGAI